jgi:Flp pilus assembly protein TadD
LDLLQGLGLLGLGAKEKARGILEGLVGSERREVARRAALALAGLEREEGRVEAGLATLDRAALATGTDGEILHLRGRLYEEDAELGSAVESYEGAARAGVGRPDVLFDLGRACLRDGRIGEGLARIREAWEKDPGLFPSAALGDPRLTDDL